MRERIKIVIADDQELIRDSLKIVLSANQDMDVIDTVADGREVIRSVRKAKPDVILMDIRMPGMDGVSCTQIIKENYPQIKIIILTTFDDDEYVFLLGFNINYYPQVFKDEDYLNDRVKNILELDTSIDKNKYTKSNN